VPNDERRIFSSCFIDGSRLSATCGAERENDRTGENHTEKNFSLPSLLMGITIGLTMKTLTVKITEDLETKLRRKAQAANQSVSEIVRHALAREMEADAVDFSKLAAPYVGMVSGPVDLSTSEGYGSRESR
jgi:hypothetical protein